MINGSNHRPHLSRRHTPHPNSESQLQQEWTDYTSDIGSDDTNSLNFAQQQISPIFTPNAAVGPSTQSPTIQAKDQSALAAPDQVETLTGSGLVFNNYWGSGFDSTSAVGVAFTADVDAAESFFQGICTNDCTLNMQFDIGAVSGNDAAVNDYQPIQNVSFATLVSDLQTHVTTADAQAAVTALLARKDSIVNQSFAVPVGMAQILGISSAQDSAIDDTITVSNSVNWSFLSGAPNDSDVVGVLEHEISEGALGRIGGLGIQNSEWGPMDLFRYAANGQPDTTPSDLVPTYFSIDGSSIDPNTSYQFHNEFGTAKSPTNPHDNGDFADWDAVGPDNQSHATVDPFGPTVLDTNNNPEPTDFSATDLAVMQVLGWTPMPDAWQGGSGDWSDGSHWNSGLAPGSDVNASIADTSVSSYTSSIGTEDNVTAGLVALSAAGATLALAGTLSVQVKMVVTAGTFAGDGGTLNCPIFDGSIDLSAANAALHLENGLTMAGSDGTGAGQIEVTGDGSQLFFQGAQGFDDATINFGDASSNDFDYLWSTDPSNAGNSVVTLGTGVDIEQKGASVEMASDSNTGDGFNFKGTLNAKIKGGIFLIEPEYFANNGTINVANGDSLVLESANFTNDATITVDGANSDLALQGSCQNLGQIDLTNGASLILESGFTFTASKLGTIDSANDSTGGTVVIDGTLDNSNATLNFSTDNIGPVALDTGGRILGGILVNVAGALSFKGGTLDGVTYEDPLQLTASGASVTVLNGITLNNGGSGNGLIQDTGAGSTLEFDGAEILDNVTIDLGNAGTSNLVAGDALSGTNGALTFGSHATIDQTGASAAITTNASDNSIAFNGTLNADASNGFLSIEANAFTNGGTMTISNGDIVQLSTKPNSFINDGSFVADGGTANLMSGIASGSTGTVTITDGGSIGFGADAAGQVISFDGAGTLVIENPASPFTATLAGMSTNDAISLIGVTAKTASITALNTLTVTQQGGPNLTYTVTGFAIGTKFTITPDISGSDLAPTTQAQPTTFTWASGVSGNFTDPSKWNPAAAPSSGAKVLITAGSTYTVTSSAAETEASVATASGATLDIKNSTFTLTDGTGGGTGANAGTFKVEDGSTFATDGSMVNNNQIDLDANGHTTALEIGGTVALSGKGSITLSSDIHNVIDSSGSAATLTNTMTGKTGISGAGTIGDQFLQVTNKGTINATGGANALVLTGAELNNAGTLSATTGDLLINTTIYDNSKTAAIKGLGKATASNNGVGVVLLENNANIVGGTLSGNVGTLGGTTSTLTATTAQPLSIAAKSNVYVNDGSTLQLAGAIANGGAINMESSTDLTTLAILQNTTLTGKGTVFFLNGRNQISAVGNVTLTNNGNAFMGDGTIENGAGVLTLINQTGAVDATDGTLFLEASAISNAGTLEATKGTDSHGNAVSGTLAISDTTVTNSFGGKSGTVGALAAGATVTLSDTTINGGTITIDAGATLEATASETSAIAAAKITNNGNLLVNNGYLSIGGTVTGKGTLTIAGQGELEIGIAGFAENASFSAGATGMLILDHSKQLGKTAGYAGQIKGFGLTNAPSAQIDLQDIKFSTAQIVKYTPGKSGTGTLTVQDNSGDVASLTFSGSYKLGNFQIEKADGNGGTILAFTQAIASFDAAPGGGGLAAGIAAQTAHAREFLAPSSHHA